MRQRPFASALSACILFLAPTFSGATSAAAEDDVAAVSAAATPGEEDGAADTDAPDESARAAADAAEVVTRLHAKILDAMQRADALGYQGRFDLLSPVVRDCFDLEFMAEKSVGRHWRLLEEPERGRWTSTFENMIIASYAGRFNAYSGQSFETLGESAAAHSTVVIQTKLVNPADEDVELNYRMRQTETGWRIVDIYLNGTVSELALRRSEYGSVLKRDGFETLLANLDRKTRELASDVSD